VSDLSSRVAQLTPEQRAALARRLQERTAHSASSVEPIAIIGMSCRFPGAESLAAFWRLLEDGGDAIREVPADRWSNDEYFDADPAASGKVTTRWGGFLEGVDRFDAAFFGISPREAAQMDPQQRLLLEVGWQALEHAGQEPARLAGTRTGVFVGAHSQSNDYALLQYAQPELMDGFTGTGAAHNLLSGRLSYLLDLQGPSLVVDTACSSSLVATHLACQSLRSAESSLAIVGGVNLILSPLFTVAASRMRMLAADGRCKPFDAAADGFTRAEGCGVVVLKKLSEALAQGDRVLAVIRGSAINQDGHTNGITAPNGLAQQEVIRRALQQAGVEGRQVSFVETHGTGTPLGDPIEVEALIAALGAGPAVALGSLKSNIGHLEGAAGVAGLIKACLSLVHGRIPRVVHFNRLNPHIELTDTRFVVPSVARDWLESGRVAGVSSFGWSGTNAHVVLQQAPEGAAPSRLVEAISPQLVVISGANSERLQRLVERWVEWCEEDSARDVPFSAIARAAALTRAHHNERLAVVASSLPELRERLRQVSQGRSPAAAVAGRALARQGVVFVFPGQGSQWLGMGCQLYASEPAFRASIDACQTAFESEVPWRLVEELHAAPAASRLAEIDVVQPLLFAIEVALAALWRAWGIIPDVVIGHSMGEVAAAHVAGALSLNDAARVICRRSRLLKRISGQGAMALVELSLADAAIALRGYEDRVSIAVSNSSRSTVISGDAEAVEAICAVLSSRDVFCRPIKVDVASHSPQVDPLADELMSTLADIAPTASAVPVCSTVTGQLADASGFDARYWVQNLRRPVLFADALRRAIDAGNRLFVELSPHPILLPSIEQVLQDAGVEGLVVASLRRNESERAELALALGRLYVAGQVADWSARWPEPAPFVELPFTPFQRERHWLPLAAVGPRQSSGGHPVLGSALEASPGTRAWNFYHGRTASASWSDFQLDDVGSVAPGLMIDAVLEATQALGLNSVLELELERPLTEADEPGARALAVLVARGEYAFSVFSGRDPKPRTTHVSARLRAAPVTEALHALPALETPSVFTANEFYQRITLSGQQQAGRLRAVSEFRLAGQHAVASFQKPTGERGFRFSPAISQACLDVAAFAASLWSESPAADLWQVTRIGELRVLSEGDVTHGQMSVARGSNSDGSRLHLDLTVFADDGSARLALRDLVVQRHPTEARASVNQGIADWCFEIDWQAAAAPDTSGQSAAGSWLVLADAQGVAPALAVLLQSRGGDVKLLSHAQLGPELRATRGPCTVVHLAGLDLPNWQSGPTEQLERALAETATGLLRTVQAVNAVSECSARVWIATRGAQPVQGALAGSGPLQAALWGLGRVVAEEHPNAFGGLIDLDPAPGAEVAAELIAALLDPQTERQVGFRGGTRYVARLAPLGAVRGLGPVLRPDGAYLISGGLNGVGLAVARWLIQQGARRLVLAGRTPLPAREEWQGLDPGSAAGQRVAAVRELEALGAAVHTPALDIADEPSVTEFFSHYERAGYPALRGIVHAAVVIEDALLQDLSPSSFEKVFRPKLFGARVLERLAERVSADFLVLFSSLGAVLGQTGQGNYAAANAAVDALAHCSRGRGLPTVSINWGGWREAGLGAASAGARRTILALEREGVNSFSTAQGLDVFGRMLGVDRAQVIVAPISSALLRRSHWVRHDAAFFSRLFAAQTAAPAPRHSDSFLAELRLAAALDRRRLFQQFLVAQLAAVLRSSPSAIDPETPLGALGLESLMALEFRNRLEAHLGLKLSATLIWNHPTVAALTSYLGERLEISFESSTGTRPAEPSALAPATGSELLSTLSELSDEDALRALTGGK